MSLNMFNGSYSRHICESIVQCDHYYKTLQEAIRIVKMYKMSIHTVIGRVVFVLNHRLRSADEITHKHDA